MRDALSGDKLKIALFGDLSLEEAMDLSRDRQILELELVTQVWESHIHHYHDNKFKTSDSYQ
jgi:hypothetical protein